MAQWRKVVVSGSNAVLNQISASSAQITTIDIDGGSITGITDLAVADGGTGASTLTDGGVLLGSGTSAVTAMSVLADGEFIVGDGSTDPVAESGATLRTSIGVGTGDSPQFTAIELGHASNTTIARSGAGDITIEGNHIYRAGGTDVAVADGGTGASSLTDGGVLLGSGTGAITAMTALGDGEMIVGDGTTDPVAESGATLRTSIGVGTGDSPQFTAVNVGAASDTTLARESAGDLTVEGNHIYRVGGTDVSVADGGTGASTLTDGGVLLGSGTGAITAMSVLADGEFIVGDGTTDPVAESGATLRTSIGVGTADNVEFANTTVDTLTNDSTVAGSHLTGSFTGSFVGDGSNLTGVGFQIDELSNTLTAVDQADLLVVADADASNEEKKITFSNFEDEIFGNVSGDINIAAGGAATIQANSVALGTDTTGNYVLDVTVGTGLGGAVASEGGTAALSLDAGQTVFTSIYNTSLIVGSEASQEYVTFGTANEVNTFIDNSEVLSVRSGGVDITGVATVSSDLTVGGNLDVNGTVTTINTANLAVNDQFIQLASGSTSETDGGIIVTKQADQAGYALGYDGGTDQWSFQNDLSPTATGIVPDAYVGVIERGTGAGDSQGVPTYGGASNGAGTIYIDTDDGEIWIYA